MSSSSARLCPACPTIKKPKRTASKAAPVRSGWSMSARAIYHGDSDAFIVRGLVAIVMAFYSGRKASDIAKADALALFTELGFQQHLSPQRSNGLRSMIERIRRDATQVLASAS